MGSGCCSKDFNYVIVLSSAESALRDSFTCYAGQVRKKIGNIYLKGPDPADSTGRSRKISTSDEAGSGPGGQFEAADRLNDASLESLQRIVLTGITCCANCGHECDGGTPSRSRRRIRCSRD